MNFLRKRRSSEDEDDDDILNNDPTSSIHKSRKPPNTAFRQQRLKAWQPILTPKSVIPLLILIAIIFTPLGIAIIYTTYNVQDLIVDYSKCNEASNSYENILTSTLDIISVVTAPTPIFNGVSRITTPV